MAGLPVLASGTAWLAPVATASAAPPGAATLDGLPEIVVAAAALSIAALVVMDLRKRSDPDRGLRTAAHVSLALLLAVFATSLSAPAARWLGADGETVGALRGMVAVVAAIIWAGAAAVLWVQRAKGSENVPPNALGHAVAELARRPPSREPSGSRTTIFIQDRELRYTWVHNPQPGFPETGIIGRTDAEILSHNGAREITALKRKALETGEPQSAPVTLDADPQSAYQLELTAVPIRNGRGATSGILGSVVDQTERQLFAVRLAALAGTLGQANRRFELALEDSPISVFEQDRELRYSYVWNPPPGTSASDFLGRSDSSLFSAAEAAQIVPAKRRVLAGGEREQLEVSVSVGGRLRSYNLSLEAKRDEDGEIVGLVGAAVDITASREGEKQMRLVMRELTHRSKNLLAVVQAMARQTASRSASLEAFLSGFSARLQAMAASHDLIVSHSWYGAGIEELLRAQLAQILDRWDERVHLEGPPVQVDADAAQSLGLAFHELITNAAKHGALGTQGGGIDITWTLSHGRVHLVWQEHGGTEVVEPGRKGFGRTLLERSVGPSLNGSVALGFELSGLRCEIDFPVSPVGVR